jgi:amino acid permease
LIASGIVFFGSFDSPAATPYDDPNLLQAAATEDIALSPFTLLYERVGFAFAASLMNIGYRIIRFARKSV